jgi:tetratricopeptide (TPR) repeat protein
MLSQLVNKSLVIVEREQGKETRYQMLETIRQYAREKLWAAGEGKVLGQRHLAYFVDLAERAEPNLRAFDMVMWLDRLETELDNIRAALEWGLETNVEAQLRLASALLWFWHIRSHKNEGIDWLERGLSIEAAERGDQPLTPSRAMIRGKALNASGILMNMFFNLKKAQARFEESLTLFQERGSAGKWGVAYALCGLASAASSADNLQQRNLVQQSPTLFSEVGDKFGVAECLMQLVGNAQKDDDYKQAVRFAEELLTLRREIGDLDGIAAALGFLSELAFWQDDYQRAITLCEESLDTFREVKNKWAISFTFSSYGDLYFWQGDYERATKIYEEALAFAQELGDRFFIAINIEDLGLVAWLGGNYARATQMITNSLAVFRDIGHLWHVASSLHALGDIALAQGDNNSAVQWYEAELAFGQETGIHMGLVFALSSLGKVAWAQDDYELAKKRFDEGLIVSREAGLKHGTFHALFGLGRVAQSQGDSVAARAYYAEMLGMQRQRISPLFNWTWLKTYGCAIAYPLEGFAFLAAAQNQMERSTRLFGVTEILYPPLRFEMSSKERAKHDQAIAAARAALGEDAFQAAYDEGKKMTLDEAVAYALEEN